MRPPGYVEFISKKNYEGEKMTRAMVICTVFILLPATVLLWAAPGFVRYPVGEAVPVETYTEPLDPCDPDPAHKFLALPPEDWARQFGNNERTMLIHAVSELRVIVAAQGKRLLELEKRVEALDPVTIEYKGPKE